MNMNDEILNSATPIDAFLGEQIDKNKADIDENTVTLGYGINAQNNLIPFERTTINKETWIDNDLSIPAGDYTFSCVADKDESIQIIFKYDDNSTQWTGVLTVHQYVVSMNLTLSKTVKKIGFYCYDTVKLSKIMFNKGTTALPYEPYRLSVDKRINNLMELIKPPIKTLSSGGTEYNDYCDVTVKLGEIIVVTSSWYNGRPVGIQLITKADKLVVVKNEPTNSNEGAGRLCLTFMPSTDMELTIQIKTSSDKPTLQAVYRIIPVI